METSTIILYKGVELTPDYSWTIDFTSNQERNDYFKDKSVHQVTQNGYKRIGDRLLKVYAPIDALRDVNYMSFIDSKDFIMYAFITKMTYINEVTTEINYEIDYLQTYSDKFTLEESFVEREHQDRWTLAKTNNQDIVYLPNFNTKKENIDYGSDYKMSSSEISAYDLQWAYIFSSKALHENAEADKNLRFKEDDTPTGFFIYATAINRSGKGIEWSSDGGSTYETLGTVNDFVNFLKIKPEVTQIFISNLSPAKLINIETNKYSSAYLKTKNVLIRDAEGNPPISFRCILIKSRSNGKYILSNINNNDILPHYKMNHTKLKDMKYESKLFTYPYNFQKISYGNNELILKREHTNYKYTIGLNNYKSDRDLEVFQSLSSEGSSIVADKSSLNPKVDGQKVLVNPTPNYVDLTTDKWLQYILTNKAQRTAGLTSSSLGMAIGGIGGIVTTAVTGNPLGLLATLGSIVGGGGQIMNQLAKEEDIRNQPPDTRAFTGDLSLTKTLSNFNPILVNCDLLSEYKKQVYDYLYHYGYKCNEFKKPDLKSRYYFNYIKTVDANIKTEFWGDVRDKIKSIFDKGITIWHYHSTDWKGVNQFEYENAELKLEE